MTDGSTPEAQPVPSREPSSQSSVRLAVRSALYSAAIVATPGLLAGAIGMANGRALDTAEQCERGHRPAVCAAHHVQESAELHREEVRVPPPPPRDAGITPLTGRIDFNGPNFLRAPQSYRGR